MAHQVTAVLHVMADSRVEAMDYAAETLRDICDRDIEGPGADGTTEEPWLVGATIDDGRALVPDQITTIKEWAEASGITPTLVRTMQAYDQTFPEPWRPGRESNGRAYGAIYAVDDLERWWTTHKVNTAKEGT